MSAELLENPLAKNIKENVICIQSKIKATPEAKKWIHTQAVFIYTELHAKSVDLSFKIKEKNFHLKNALGNSQCYQKHETLIPNYPG